MLMQRNAKRTAMQCDNLAASPNLRKRWHRTRLTCLPFRLLGLPVRGRQKVLVRLGQGKQEGPRKAARKRKGLSSTKEATGLSSYEEVSKRDSVCPKRSRAKAKACPRQRKQAGLSLHEEASKRDSVRPERSRAKACPHLRK